MNHTLLAAELTREEGIRFHAYDDSTGYEIHPGSTVKGHPTIGVGRCLDTHGITAAEADYLLANDISRVEAELTAALPWFSALDDVRQRVLAQMAFQMGVSGLLNFHDTLRYISEQRWELAYRGMLDSLWAKQTPKRAERLAGVMRMGIAIPTNEFFAPSELRSQP